MPGRGRVVAASSVPAWALALLVFGVSFLLLELCVDVPPLHEDTARDLSLARDCVDAGRCAMAGPTSSFGGLTQGALWIHLLEVSRVAGLGIGGVRAIVLGLASAAGVLVAFTPRQLCGWAGGPAAWALSLAATASAVELPVLWNPSVLPLPLALFHAAMLALAATGAVPAAGAMGIGLALSMDAHLICAGWVPFALGVVVATAARPVLATFVAVVLMVASSVASSAGTLEADHAILAAWWGPSAAVIAVSLSIALIIRRRVRAAEARARVRAVLSGSCAYFILGVLGACVATAHPLAPRYFAPVVPAAAILLSGVAVGWRPLGSRRALAGNVAIVVGVGLIGLRTTLRRSSNSLSWTALDAEPLARALSARGWTFGDLYRHLRGPQAREVLAGLGPYLPAPDGAPHALAQDDLLLLKVTRASVHAANAEEWIVADLTGTTVAVGRRSPSWLDVDSLEICAGRTASDAHCVRTGLSNDDPDRGAVGTFSQRAYSGLEDVRQELLSREGSRPDALRWTLAVRLRPVMGSLAHTLTLSDPAPAWQIERVDGARYRGQLPAREVILESVSGEGRIVFGVDVIGEEAGRFRPWLPSMIETGADEGALRALLADHRQGSR